MLEHIFRNIMDIRIFDVFNCEFNGRDDIEIDEIIEVMEVPYYERFAVEESIEHLVKQKILQLQHKKYPSWSGCKTCSYLDKLHLPRFGKHKKHVPYTVSFIEVPIYGTAINQVTIHLYKAVFEHIQSSIEEENK